MAIFQVAFFFNSFFQKKLKISFVHKWSCVSKTTPKTLKCNKRSSTE